MGLTIHYRLQAKGPEAHARKLVNSLHQAAQDLPFKQLGPLVELSGDDCRYDRRKQDDPLRWLLIQAQESVSLKHLPGESEYSSIHVTPLQMIAFTAWPGEGCEEANIGLCRFPAEVQHPRHGRVKTRLSGWHWSSFCKTQYASDPKCGGVPHFLQCHLTVIALLDEAKELGCLRRVADESGFWKQRQLEALVTEVGSWNEMGSRRLWRPAQEMCSVIVWRMPIADFTNFEHLEAAGQSQPGIQQLTKIIKQVSQKS